MTPRRRMVPVLGGLLLSLGALVAAAPASPLPDLEHAARPLRSTEPSGDLADLRPLGRMVAGAQVVGLGEATHSSHEFFTLKHRVFRYLVERQGFRTFALEDSWSTGQRLNDYVLHGKGDIRRIMREEFQESYSWWNNREYLELLEWMRSYNRQHPDDPVRFMGDDFAYAGPELYDKVTGYAARAHPELLPRFTELYRGLRPVTDAGTYMREYLKRPPAARREMARRTGQALALLKRQTPAGPAGRTAHEWAVQHATAIDQTARGYAFDFDDQRQVAAAMRYRDSVMAANVLWWNQHTGSKILLSAHDAHVSHKTFDPDNYPKVQGEFLRDRLGKRYLNIATTFGQGSFNATGPDGKVTRHTVGPARPGSNERTLDRVRYRDYVLDLRKVASTGRDWLGRARPTRSIGTAYPGPGTEYPVALGRSYDVLIHLHRVRAARLLGSS
ncbi:erythromycin esterase family protein [Streptomyces sp. NPDC052396]|uniref:erythromycin esterase family protein n=1 Tax=Streptomyces sp. NPDC052396 TaxID=3365689 RepID=UPI0037D32999